ncbi:hypothetical protein RFI_11496 [Reticulomyxa filosa]|uniref:Caspase family p20 domain-containing protein n=1 Tax=Reticulomyxa filosa TaxID=46433 RepID=X6NIS5_RETFI|nr:hypothetical protein RFI_11496 [Reticulomyxa filosa]|eukprot:ETO25639.1 hypothetical protein RFI_11496 [Reticulomyxa filosa]
MEWWNKREQKDKTEIIGKFKTMSNEQFGVWLLNECKWKCEIAKDDITSIRFSIEAFLAFTNQDSKEEEEFKAYVIIDESKKLIKMKILTFEELLRQSHNCLELKHFQKMRDKHLKLELINMKDNIIESDEAVKREFENNEPTFKILWNPLQQPLVIGKTKAIKNALVVMIAISEYEDNNKWPNLESAKDIDINNFKYIFEQELHYEFVYNEESKMNKDDVNEFLAELVFNHKLHKNKNQYDALIMIISGHGDEGDVLVTSDGKYVSIDKIRSSFNSHEMESLKDSPKIFIIDVCRGSNVPQSTSSTQKKGKQGKEQNNIHNDNGFLMIWSTTKGYQVGDLSLFSESVKNTVVSKYKIGYPLSQMLREIREDIKKKGGGEWYCVESQDTIDYDISFQQRKLIESFYFKYLKRTIDSISHFYLVLIFFEFLKGFRFYFYYLFYFLLECLSLS